MKSKTVIAAIDAGKYENLGVFIRDRTTTRKSFFDDFLEEVRKTKKGAIGFEAPLFLPAGNLAGIGKQRIGRPAGQKEWNLHIDRSCGRTCAWASPVGSIAMARGIILLEIFLEKLSRIPELRKVPVYTEFRRDRSFGILIYEAFISGHSRENAEDCELTRTNPHDRDAELACKLFDDPRFAIEPVEVEKYLNLPLALAGEWKIRTTGSRNKGVILKSPKPDRFNHKNVRKIELFWPPPPESPGGGKP